MNFGSTSGTSSAMQPRREKPDRFIRSVKLTGLQKRYLPNKRYVYVFKVKWSDGTGHVIYRSYSDFYEFHSELVDLFPLEAGLLSANDRVIPNFPRRKFYQNNEMRQFARQQQVQFEHYCNQLINMKSAITKHPFLLLFFQPKFEDIDPSHSILKKPEKKNKLIKMIQKFSIRKKSARRMTIFEPPPELPKGVMAEQYKALNSFTADVEGQVGFEEGGVVKVIEQNSSGWWIAEVPSGETGWVPGSFLEKLGNAHEFEECINIDGDLYISIQSYTSQNDDELSFDVGVMLMVMQKRMSGWWIARYDGEVGYVPAAYLVQYTNEDYLRVCTPIMPLRAKAATTDHVTPLPEKKAFFTVGLTPQIGMTPKIGLTPQLGMIPQIGMTRQIQKSPRRLSVVEMRGEEEALQRAKTMAIHSSKSKLMPRDANNNTKPTWKPMIIPEIVVTEPADEGSQDSIPVYASVENIQSKGSQSGTDEKADESKTSTCLVDGSWQNISIKDTNLKQATPKNKRSSKVQPSSDTDTPNDPNETGASADYNNKEFYYKDWTSLTNSIGAKTGSFKLTHDNAFAKLNDDELRQRLLSVRSSASESDIRDIGGSTNDISNTSTTKSLRKFGSVGSFFDKLSTVGLAGSLCNLDSPASSTILFDKLMNSCISKTWSNRACAGSAPNLHLDLKTPSPVSKFGGRKPFEEKQHNIETTFDLGVKLGWFGDDLKRPELDQTPFILTPRRHGLLTTSPYPTDADNSVFHHEPTPVQVFSVNRNPPFGSRFIPTPRTAANMNWVIFRDQSADMSNLPKVEITSSVEKRPVVLATDHEEPNQKTASSPPMTVESKTSDSLFNSQSQPAIERLVGAIENLTEAISKGIPGLTRILVKDACQQCASITLPDDYDSVTYV